MEFEIIEKQLEAIIEDLDLIQKKKAEIEITGILEDVTAYCQALNNIRGSINLIKMTLKKLENPDEP